MAAHAIASLTISFGLVSIPVKLYAATRASSGVRFNFIHDGCGSRLRQQYVCIREDVVVPRDEMVRGYEFAPDQYVVFSKEELKALEEEGTGAAEICEFLPLPSVDPVYFDKAYYLVPDKGGAKPYALLREALARSGRGALGRYAARGKQYLVLIRAIEHGLSMQQLLYADDVREIDELDIGSPAKIGDKELELALQLIEQLASDEFHPERYRDEVRERVEAAVQQKIEGQEISVSTDKPAEAGGKVIDLMEALRASLKGRGGSASPAAAPAPAGAARATRKPARKAAPAPAPAPARKAAGGRAKAGRK